MEIYIEINSKIPIDLIGPRPNYWQQQKLLYGLYS